MKNIPKDILDLLSIFDDIEFEFQINDEKHSFSFKQFEEEYALRTNNVKTRLRELLLNGENMILLRIKKNLLAIKNNLINNLDKFETYQSNPRELDPTTFGHLYKIQLKYAERLISYIQKLSKSEIRSSLKDKKNFFSHTEIAYAFAFLKEQLTKENARKILNKYSTNLSVDKLLSKRTGPKELTLITGNKSADTKKLNSLLAAERLIKSTKDKKAKSNISSVIKAFQTSYDSHYN